MPFVGMLIVIMVQVFGIILNKKAMSKGLSEFILALYSNAITTLILMPCAFLIHRSWPRLFHTLTHLYLYNYYTFESFHFLCSYSLQVRQTSTQPLSPFQLLLSRANWVRWLPLFEIICKGFAFDLLVSGCLIYLNLFLIFSLFHWVFFLFHFLFLFHVEGQDCWWEMLVYNTVLLPLTPPCSTLFQLLRLYLH